MTRAELATFRRLRVPLRAAEAEESISIPLDVAMVCPETTCRTVFNGRAGACPHCGTVDALPLAAVLDGRRVRFRARLTLVEMS